MNTFKNAEYTITTSLSDQSASIYVKIANNISYAAYEGTFEKSAFRLSFEIAGIYRLINKCFAAFTCGEEDPKYSVAFELESNSMCLAFRCAIEEFLVIDFEIRLREKTVSGDSICLAELEKQKQLVEALKEQVEKQATEIEGLKKTNEEREWFETNFRNSYNQMTKMVETQNLEMSSELSKLTNKVKTLEQSERQIQKNFEHYAYNTSVMLDALSNAHIVFWSGEIDKKFEVSYPIGITELEISYAYGTKWNIYGRQSYEKIKFFYRLQTLILKCASYDILWEISSESLQALRLYEMNGNDMSFVRNFPNLEEIYVEGGNNNNCSNCIGEALSNIPNKIKKLTFLNCKLSNLDKLQPYCRKNNIELYLS